MGVVKTATFATSQYIIVTSPPCILYLAEWNPISWMEDTHDIRWYVPNGHRDEDSGAEDISSNTDSSETCSSKFSQN